MALVTIKIKVTANDDVQAWWVAIDESDFTFNDDVEEIDVEGQAEHLLYYWIQGNPGGKLEITVKQGPDELRKISETVPPGYSKVGNARFFKTN
jgi:hypothetical protein